MLSRNRTRNKCAALIAANRKFLVVVQVLTVGFITHGCRKHLMISRVQSPYVDMRPLCSSVDTESAISLVHWRILIERAQTDRI